jgi:GntR family transcriptional regulator
MLEGIATMRRHTLTRLIDIAEITPPAKIKEDLALRDHESACRMIRVRLTEDEQIPFAYYVSWTTAPIEIFTEEALEAKTRIELMREQGIHISRIDQLLSAELAKEETARELNVKQDAPLLKLVRRSFDSEGKLVDILEGSYNPEIFQYKMSMSLNDDGNPEK